MEWAVAAENFSPVRKYSRALAAPIRATTNGLINAGTMPSFTSVNPNCAFSVAMLISHAATRPEPPPSAAPWTRAMTGLGQRTIVKNISIAVSASRRFSSGVNLATRLVQFRSAPALKDFPFPWRTIARTSWRVPRSLNVCVRRPINSSLSALWISGRLRVTRAIEPSMCVSSIGTNVASDIGDDVFGGCPGLEDFTDAQFLQFRNVLVRNDSPDDDEDVIELFFFHQFQNAGNQRHMGTGEHRKSNDIDVLLKRRAHDLFRCLSEARIDHFKSGIAESACDDLRTTVMAVEAGFCNEYSNSFSHQIAGSSYEP